MRPTPRTQPYRRGAPRPLGDTLQAMLQGRIPGQVNGGDFERQRRQGAAQGQLQAGALQQMLAQQMGGRPVASINDPNQHPQRTVDRWPAMQGEQDLIAPGGQAAHEQMLHDLILRAMQQLQRRRPSNGGVAAPPFAHI